VHEKMPKLFPKSVSAIKGVEGKHAHEQNGKNAKYSRSPMEEFDAPIQSFGGLPQTGVDALRWTVGRLRALGFA
jgi:hypothetical protein